jgi:hypothetical protein
LCGASTVVFASYGAIPLPFTCDHHQLNTFGFNR